MKGLFIGVTSVDIIYQLKEFPDEDSKNYAKSQIIDIGGPATNAAFTFSALGGQSTLISVVGRNPLSPFVKQKMIDYGIHHLDLNADATGYPPISSILVNQHNGSRTLASTKPVPAKALNLDQAVLPEYDVVCIDGFHADCALDILKQNHRVKPVVFDGGSYKLKTDEILNYVSYPLFSEHFEFPSGILSDSLQEKGIKQFAVTHGENPIQVVDNERTYEIPVPPTKALDTLGAGDIFHGAFCHYILQLDFRSSLIKAAGIAGLSCQFLGTREWSNRIATIK